MSRDSFTPARNQPKTQRPVEKIPDTSHLELLSGRGLA